ncbi:hypothetical protein L3X38_015518 [Prunus dulcis]|uniref:FMN-dependent dehydrogenase domain-containing protein n=1 Tax=Prunus dulcis TaxID=3755 RepID=A0AAD4W485_PRUDU|nr:hypothetical protein L3X38_015518 [Prunus dulcis]
MASEPVSVNEFRELARQVLPKMLRPRVLVDVSRIDMPTTVLGYKISAPIMIAPTARHQLAHPEGELRAPIFNGSNYNFWKIKMCTIFKSHKLWDMVENGYEQSVKKEEEEALTTAQKLALEENVAKDAKALGLIKGAVSDDIFPRIALKRVSQGSMGDPATRVQR